METDNQFQDIVDILQAERIHRPTTITLQEICAGRVPQSMVGSNKVNREKAFDDALNRFYESTENNI